MAQVLIRRLDEKVVHRLKASARAAGRSLEEECRLALERITKSDALAAEMDRWAEEDAGRGAEPNPWDGIRTGAPPRDVALE